MSYFNSIRKRFFAQQEKPSFALPTSELETKQELQGKIDKIIILIQSEVFFFF